MVYRSRYLLAATLGLFTTLAPAQEPGRLGLDRGLAPVSANQQLADALARHIKESGRLQHYTLDLTCQGSTVELNGTVTDQTQCDQALRLVQGFPGVERVINRLQLADAPSVLRVQAEKAPVLPALTAPGDAPAEKKKEGLSEPLPMLAAPSASQSDLNPPKMPPYAWPTYSPYNNFSRVAYPLAYPYNAWPYIGPIYPFPKIPLGWRAVKLEFEDGHWWFSRTATKKDWWHLRFW